MSMATTRTGRQWYSVSSVAGLTLLVLTLASLSPEVHAQVLTGNIIGTVTDDSGAVLPGVTVTLNSRALPAGPLSTTTNERGQYRFMQLNPGTYTLTTTLAGFSTYEERDLRVVVSGSVERVVVLKLASVAETITVSGQAPIVDPQKVGVTANLTQEVVEELPSRRQSVASFVKWAGGGVAPQDPSGYSANVSVMGSGTGENSILYNGIMSNTPSGGGYWAQGDVDAIEEVQVVTLGASAEYQVAQGAVFNLAVKQGTNSWKFDAQGHWYPDALQSKPIKLPCNCDLGSTGYSIERLHEYSGHAGGPLVKDRLWFFGGGMYTERAESNPGVDPRLPRTQIEHTAIGRVTWQVSERLKLSQMLENEWYAFPSLPSVTRPFETVTNLGSNKLPVYASEANWTRSSNTLIIIRATGWFNPQDYVKPLSGDTTTSFRLDQSTGIACCGVQSFGWQQRGRHGQIGKISHYIHGSSIDHNVSAGIQFEEASESQQMATPGGVQYSDLRGAPDQATFRPPTVNAASYTSQGAWAQNQMMIGDRLTLSLGARFDRMHAKSPDGRAIDDRAEYTGAMIAGLGDLFTWTTFAPRLGFNVKLSKSGKITVRGNYGRAYRAISTGDFVGLHPGVSASTLARYDPTTGRYSTIISVTDPRSNIALDRDLQAPFTDQFSIGFDRELMANLGVDVTYVHKYGENQVGQTDVGGVYGTQVATLPDGRTLTVFPRLNSASAQRFLTTNGPGLFNKYDGLVIGLNKRPSNRWLASAWYTYSRSHGLITTGTAGRDPNDLTNATGRLSTDRPHIFSGSGSYEVPIIDLRVSASLMALSGTPFAPQALISLPQGRRAVNIAPPDGTFRIPAQKLLFVRVSKVLFRDGDRRLEVSAELANALQDKGYQGVASQDFFATNFGQSAGNYIQPRRLILLAKTYF